MTRRTRCSYLIVCNLRLAWYWSLVLGLLVACSNTTTPTGSTTPSAAVGQAAPAVTVLTMWHSWSSVQADALNMLARNYEQTNPGVRIRLEAQPAATLLRNFNQQVADASAPQIVIVPGRYVGDLVTRQYLVPLDESGFTLNELQPAAVDTGRVNGQLYAVPLTVDALVLFHDRRAYATPPASFDELTAPRATTAMTDTAQWGLGYYLSLERTLPYLPAFGGALYDAQRQPVFASSQRPATEAWLGWLRDLHTNPAVLATPDFSVLDTELQQGRILSMIDWAHQRPRYEQLWGAPAVGIAALPPITPGAPQTLVRADVAGINTVTSADQRALAQDVLRYMVSPAAQTLLAQHSRNTLLPAHAAAEVDATSAALRTMLNTAQPLNSTTTTIWQPLDDMVRSVVSNATSPTDAVTQAGASVTSQAQPSPSGGN